jgi:amino acid adenylation domain-containing protein
LAKEVVDGDKRLVGYVVVEGELDKEKIQEALKLSLPEYMIPQLWVALASMPLTANGKLDRKSLPAPDGSELSTLEYVAARTETEVQLVEIWQELLGVARVGIHDNFFELGGHSLLATRLVSKIRKELNIEVAIREVFEYSTIASLAEHLSIQTQGVLLPTIIAQERPLQIPLSFSQERLWFIDELEGSIAYHIPVVIRLEGALDISSLEGALKGIISRHEVLRTTIYAEEGVGYQKIVSASDWSLDQENISDESSLESILEDSLTAPFDLSKDYNLRACLYALGNKKYVLSLVFHHIASDGWSKGILVHEFTALYNTLQSGQNPVLPALSLQYSDYAIWQRKYLEGAILEDQLLYWEEKLQGVETLLLPTDHIRPSIQSKAGASLSFNLSKELTTSFNDLCQQEGVTLFMFLLSAFKVLLSRYSGQEDICVGTPIANRTQSELEGMIGFFVNTLALRSDLSNNPSFREVLYRVKSTTLKGYDHQLAPFEKIVDRVVSTRDRSRSPLFQVLFVLQNTPEVSSENTGLDGVVLSAYETKHVTSQFDLTLNISEHQEGASLHIEYCTSLFDSATIERLFLHYQELLTSIVADISQPIGSLSMLTQAEENQLLHDFNATAVVYPKDKTVVDLFEEQVKKTPDAIAVVYEGEELSYRELDKRSNQLARYLISKGVVADDLVGLCINRSIEMVIGILGILKSGGAYVPIDPNYPQARIVYILEDAGIKVLLSSSDVADSVSKLGKRALILLDADSEEINKESTKSLVISLSVSNLAYVIYTSGSTGKPKGVLIEHRNIINTILSQIPAFSITNKDNCLQFASLSFDASIWEIFTSLFSGARLCIIEEASKSDPIFFRDFIANNAITIATLPPAFLQLVSVEDLKSIRTLVTAGESISLKLAKTFSQHYNYINAYGPTETSICATTFHGSITDLVPIGKPIDNTQIYILNEEQLLLPIGVVG